jgi:glucose PTS system EIICB or EIICBA component
MLLGQRLRNRPPRGEHAPGPVSERTGEAGAEVPLIAQRLLNAFGGPSNVQAAEHVAVARLRFVLRDASRTDQEALKLAGTAGVIKASEKVWHVIVGQRAPAIAAALNLNLDASSIKTDQFALTK